MAGSPGIVTGCRAPPRPAESTSATLQMEQERNRAALEVDLALDDELAREEAEEPMHLAAELSAMVPFVQDQADEEVVKRSWQLARVPDALVLGGGLGYAQRPFKLHAPPRLARRCRPRRCRRRPRHSERRGGHVHSRRARAKRAKSRGNGGAKRGR